MTEFGCIDKYHFKSLVMFTWNKKKKTLHYYNKGAMTFHSCPYRFLKITSHVTQKSFDFELEIDNIEYLSYRPRDPTCPIKLVFFGSNPEDE